MVLQRLVFLLFAGIFFMYAAGCKKASTDTLNEMVDTAAVLKYSGSFIGQGGQSVSGQAEIYLQNGKYFLKLADFKSDNGPDLKVYLSKDIAPFEHISLGDMKSNNGNQVYEILVNLDFKVYKYALIHCEKFNHRYGSAELK